MTELVSVEMIERPIVGQAARAAFSLIVASTVIAGLQSLHFAVDWSSSVSKWAIAWKASTCGAYFGLALNDASASERSGP